MKRTVLLAGSLILGSSAFAQSWSLVGSGSSVAFGVDGTSLTADPGGLLGYDELAAQTLLPQGAGGWVALPAQPPARQFATFAGSSTWVYLFGGASASGLRNDLWRYRRTQSDWLQLAAGGVTAPGPSPRVGARAAELGNGLLLFGGSDASGLRKDTWALFVGGGVPLWVPQQTPAAMQSRMLHAMARAPGGRIVLFGGDHAGPLGDTWLFDPLATSWSQHAGSNPPPATAARMAYDPTRDMTVMLHPNGETWEWNGFAWRRVGVTAQPAWVTPALAYSPIVGLRAYQSTPSGVDAYAYTPSPARYDVTLDAACSQQGGQLLELINFERSLPTLGDSLHLRATGMVQGSLFVGGYELSIASSVPLMCGCLLALDTTATSYQFVAGVGSSRDWLLPIQNNPGLIGVSVDVQGFVFEPTNPCWLTSTQRGTFVPGR